MTPPPPTSEPESQFEHPAFGGFYLRVLRDVADRRLEPATRKAAARALAFLLREQLVTERVATDVLAAIHTSLDLSAVVRTLLLGLRDVLGDHERIVDWTRAVVDRALREGHFASFITAMRILTELRGYDGAVPSRWRLSIIRTAEVPELAPRELLLVKTYAKRFPHESWPWIREALVRSMVASLRQRVTVAEMREARQP